MGLFCRLGKGKVNAVVAKMLAATTLGMGKIAYLRSMKGTELPSMYWGILPSHFWTAS